VELPGFPRRAGDEEGSGKDPEERLPRVSRGERMHFSRSSEVLYFHTDVVSVHTDSHTDLRRHVVVSWAIYAEYKAT